MFLLRLCMSVAIYQPLIKLTYGNFPRECRFSMKSSTTVFCHGIDVDEAISFIPSNITKLEFSNMRQKDLTLSFQAHLPSLKTLKLVNGHLETIGLNSLSGITHLEHLDLGNNKLSHLQQGTFLGLLNLQTLKLQGNEFSALDHVLPTLFSVGNLTLLDLSNNLFDTISFEEPEKLSTLSVNKVNFNGCRITNADSSVFSNWNVYELDISENPIDEKCFKNISIGLKNSSVRILKALKLSSLVFNYGEGPLIPLYRSKIEMLTIGQNYFAFTLSFRSFDSLKNLQIIKSSSVSLDMSSLLTLPNLEHLKMSGNSFENLQVSKLNNNQSRLKTLALYDNQSPRSQIPIIPEHMYSSLSNLEKLELEKNPFGHTIRSKMFSGLHKLLKLRLADSSIEQVEDAAFSDLKSLKFLSLERNKLRFLRAEMFIGLHNLVNLYLDNNLLSFVSDTTPFRHLTSLEILDLKYNQITSLEPSYLANLTTLVAVDFSNNQIVPWNVSIIPEDGNLSFLLLQSNNLITVTPAMLKDFDGLYLVNLAENQFDCWDCNMIKFQQWVQSTNVTIEDLNTYTCHFPYFLKGASIETVVIDTNHCGLEQGKTILLAIIISCTIAAILLLGMASFKLRWHFRYCCYLLRSRVKRFKEVHDSVSYEYDAFVSYDPSDCDWITHQLLATLETDNTHIKFCLLDRDCVAGNDLTEEIFEVIQKCRKILLVLSESYIKNQWCMFDLQMAQHSLFEGNRDSLILIQLQPVQEEMISANLAYLITTRTYIMWTDHPIGQKLFWKRLQVALAKPDTFQMSWIV